MAALSAVGETQEVPSRFPLFPVGLQWTVTLDGPLSQPPGFGGTYGVLAFDSGRLTGYDLVRGVAIWSVERHVSASPVLDESRVFVISDSRLVALDLVDGRTLWELELAAPPHAPISALGGWLMAVTESGEVTAYRATDGIRLWSIDIGGPSAQPVAIVGERAYVARRDGTIVSLRLENGSRVWERRVGGEPQPILALIDRVYVGSTDNYVYCLVATDGRIDWRWRTGGDIVGVLGYDSDRVYVVSMDTLVRGLDRRSGAQRWKQALTLRPTQGLVVAPGALLVAGVGQTIQGVTIKDGSSVGTIEADGLLAAAPHVVPAPALPSSLVVYVARSLEKGTMTAVTRSLEPPATPIQPLPDPKARPRTSSPTASNGPADDTPQAPLEPPPPGAPATESSNGAPPRTSPDGSDSPDGRNR